MDGFLEVAEAEGPSFFLSGVCDMSEYMLPLGKYKVFYRPEERPMFSFL